jgi:hypothetical protein
MPIIRHACVVALVLTCTTTVVRAQLDPPPAPPAEVPAEPAPPEVPAEPAAPPAPAPAPESSVPPPESRIPVASIPLTSVEAQSPPTFHIWKDASRGAFLKPVLQISSSVAGYRPKSTVNPELANRLSTLLVSRFGLEGQLYHYITFRSVFERNLGFSLGRNGPVGTSVWEGTASLSSRESFIRLARFGWSVTGGIVSDPGSVDYVSENALDLFGMDPYVRDPLLFSGFNQGQAVLVNYANSGLTAGLALTGGNPLVSSLAFAFGGDVSSLGTLFTAPLRSISSGTPGAEIQMNVISPSVTFERGPLGVKVAFQYYLVDVDVTQDEDVRLTGYNVRSTAEVKLLGDALRLFGSASYRGNEQVAIPDISMRKDPFSALTLGGGLDYSRDRFSVGAMYYRVHRAIDDETKFTDNFVNVGATYRLSPSNVSAGLRWARSVARTTSMLPTLDTDSVFLSLRLMI